MAIDAALEDVKTQRAEQVPQHLRDAHYPGAKAMGHGEGYIYPHSFPGQKVEQIYLHKKASYYKPRYSGFERELAERLKKLKNQA